MQCILIVIRIKIIYNLNSLIIKNIQFEWDLHTVQMDNDCN